MKNERTLEKYILKFSKRIYLTIVISVAVFCFSLVFFLSISEIKNLLDKEVKSTCDSIEWASKSALNVAKNLGAMPYFSREDVSAREKQIFIEQKCSEYGFSAGKLVFADGFTEAKDIFYGDRKYFIKALEGNSLISDPLLERSDKSIAVVAASPLWKDGYFSGEVDAVIALSLSPDYFNTILRKHLVSKNTLAYIITFDGTTVAASNPMLSFSQNNNIKNASFDKKFRTIAKIERKIISGRTGELFSFEKSSGLVCYASYPLQDTPGWKLILRAPVKDFLVKFNVFVVIMTGLLAIGTLYSILQARRLTRKIVPPIQHIAERLRQAAEGDYTSEVQSSRKFFEIETMSEATQSLLNRMDLVLNGSENLKKSIDLNHLISRDDFELLARRFSEQFNTTISVRDVTGALIIGKENFLSKDFFKQPITVNDRLCGFVELVPEAKASIAAKEYIKILKTFTEFLTKTAEYNFEKNVNYQIWKENENLNIKHFMRLNEELSGTIREWIGEIEKFDPNTEKKAAFKRYLATFNDFAKNSLYSMDETFEYLKFMDFNIVSKESNYAVREMITEITDTIKTKSLANKALDLYSKRNSNIVDLGISEENFMNVEIQYNKGIQRRLFGNKDAIKKIVLRFIEWFRSRNSDKHIQINFSTIETYYCFKLNVDFSMEKGLLSREEITLLKNLADNTFESQNTSIENYISGLSHLQSTVRLAHNMNFEIKISETNYGNVIMIITIPQLDGAD